MKKIIAIISVVTLSSFSIFSQTQIEMNQDSYDDFHSVETLRKQVISEIESLYSDNPEFLLASANSEKNWEKYRDAFLNMIFPGENKRELYGSVYPMAYNQQKAGLTQQHIKELQIWLDGIEEGDVGWGSVMIKRTIKEKANKHVHFIAGSANDPLRTQFLKEQNTSVTMRDVSKPSHAMPVITGFMFLLALIVFVILLIIIIMKLNRILTNQKNNQ
ncbi:MAG: lysozyme inhibitor LprI family protein [Lentisphaeria bacterium]